MTTPAQIRQTVTFLLAGTGLHITETGDDLVITNPARPDRGMVLVSLTDGRVFWQRQTTDYFGHLEGVPASQHETPADSGRPVPALMILHLLTAITGPM
jgi:hypothetical protein